MKGGELPWHLDTSLFNLTIKFTFLQSRAEATQCLYEQVCWENRDKKTMNNINNSVVKKTIWQNSK